MIWPGLFAGFVWVLLYNIIEAVRDFFERGILLRVVEDFIIAVVFAVSTYMFMYIRCDGVVRGYNYVSLVGGVAAACIILEKIREMIYIRRAQRRALGENK